jgi:glycosyltransferase involved in cell wall biosynthesis
MRIALVAPPFLPVPPPRYGGTERIVSVLANGFHRRGHDVTVFAAGDSSVEGRLVPIVPQSVWNAGRRPDTAELMARINDQVAASADEFEVIHSHVDWYGFELAQRVATPVVSTLHGRIDIGPTADVIASYPEIGLIAISERQRSFWPDQNWLATIHHGLPLDDALFGTGSGGYLLFIGRLTPEKGVEAAVELARRAKLPLVIAAKAIDPHELAIYRDVVEPAERAGIVTFLGEVGMPARDRLFADARATVMLGDWPEPFGLVAVESLAAGTPLIARRAGALPEIVRDGVDGFVVDDVDAAVAAIGDVALLDRTLIRKGALERFSADRMVDKYEHLFAEMVAIGRPDDRLPGVQSEEPKTPLVVP